MFLLSSFLYASQDARPADRAISYQMIEDTQSLSADQISTSIKAAPLMSGHHNLGYSNSVFWLKLIVRNPSDQPQLRWLDMGAPRLQSVTLYMQQNGRWQSRASAGLDTPLSLHPVKARHAVFPLQLPAQAGVVILLRVQSKTAMAIAPAVYDPVSFRENEVAESLWAGVLLGAFGIVGLYCVLLFIFMRDHSFLYHGLAIFFFVLNEACMRGYGALYFWPESTIWSVHSLSFFGQICALFFLLFVRHFLNLSVFLPWGDKVIKLMLAWNLLAIFISQCVNYQRGTMMGLLLILITVPLLLAIFLQVIRKGANAMRYFAGGLFILMVGNILRALDLFGVLSSGQVLGEHFMLFVIVFSMLSFLLAIMDRVMLARQEKETAQKTLIDTLNSQQALLEKAVDSRTAELKAAVKDAQLANQLKTKLLAYIGHDLRAPLSTMIAYAKRMRRGESFDNFSMVVERSAGQQLELIDELLKYARGEMVEHHVQFTAGCFQDFIDDIQGQAELLATQYQNRFIYLQKGEAPEWLYADWKHLRQVLQNLLSNSAKFTRYGVISLTLEWQAGSADQSELKVAVEDTGVGMNQSDHARVFLPFERAQESESKEGHGLGLAIASQMVKSMGGELKVESAVQLGSRFYFCLHLQHAAAVYTLPLPKSLGPALPHDDIQQLQLFIASGQVTEIENWAEKIALLSAEHAQFSLQVEKALQYLDFEKLQALADDLLIQPDALHA
ncbi:sensor histidine kinase [Janthinobacterium sp. B9-8]|uniref:sensor histidine kinase n=1 Tax=Janthinobacterium sp. B9-8 TaxID=1236179 RepID=UPI0012E3D898|nr:sensor histidine kinase [Janthinobacterium sp. B9-8]